ncbi:Stage II sporulation protein related to metaloproteases [Candidatus Arthromitus sp. SFB-mouse-NL]|uniref:M23 family metallopeptidase n=1 Tax=Candidatus Arthromitus sp. SFB-mouse-NL TaxID=1508644 RepID=UPI00049A1F0F|nr:M23 family metallopeptidase [Candidatus Arthromitus sp. SFB-mouse-NL]AID45244.1 Stage II sporulation protein related to metaloproteases [Candidatus Arthromitus sp. SFB-mouse-NL]
MNNLKRTKVFGKKEKINLFVFIGIAIVLALIIYFSNSSFNNNYAEGNKTQVTDNTKFNEELNINESNMDNALQVNNIPSDTNTKNEDVLNTSNNQEVKDIVSKNDNLDKLSNTDIATNLIEDKKDLVNKDVVDVDLDKDNVQVSASTLTFSSPVEGSLIREYSVDTMYSKTLNTWRTRDGVDLKADKGESVMSVLDGVVEKIDNDLTEKGQYIVIKHDNGFKSVYTNLDEEIKVVNGQKVRKGEVIATVGNSSGNYSNEDYGSHLNFVMYLNNEEVNPADYINFK